MKVRAIAILLSWVSVTPAICEAGGGQFVPITDSARRIEIPGVSVLPPSAGHWFLFPASPQDPTPNALIRLAREMDGPPPARPEDARMVVAGVMVMDSGDVGTHTPAEFLQAFTGGDPKELIGQMITPRQRLIGFDVALDDSLKATCAKYTRVTEITGQFPAFPDMIAILATRGLHCVHPIWPQYFLDVTYQQAYAKGQAPLSLDAEAEGFFKTLVFTEIRPVAVNRASSGTGTGRRPAGDIPPPSKIKDVRPDYPKEAQLAFIEGDVVVEATIGSDGRVEGARVIQSIPQLDQAAMNAVRQWEYTPTVVNGRAVPVIMTVTVSFRLP